MGHFKTGVTAFDTAVYAAELTRQNAVAGATQAAAMTAEIAYYRACYKAAVANNLSPSVFSQALTSLGVNP
jgi:hypothetical protein